MEDGNVVLCDGSGGDAGVEKGKPLPGGGMRRPRTLPAELDLSVENGGRPLRLLSPLTNGTLRHHHSDESDYRPCGARAEGIAAAAAAATTTRYTSLRDVLPSLSAHSPTAAAAWPHDGEISIQNRLVKQAARAYLQPMAAADSPRSALARGFHRRIGCDGDGCFGFIEAWLVPAVRQVFERFRGMFAARDR